MVALIKQTQAERIMAIPKYMNVPLLWEAKSNQLGTDLISEQFQDDTGALIPGLTMRLERKREFLIQGRCRWELGLFQYELGKLQRVYQLHVAPPDKASHRDDFGVIYGPHEHIGDVTLPVKIPNIDCQNFHNAFKMLCQRVNLTFSGDINELLLA